MSTDNQIIDAVLAAEGGFVDNPADRGSATNMGITLAVLSRYRGHICTVDELKALTPAEARAIYHELYLVQPGFWRIEHDALRAQLVDFGVNSGPARAIRWLQRVIGVPVTGLLDDATFAALHQLPLGLVNNALVAARLRMYADLVGADATQHVFAAGWYARALTFYNDGVA